MKRNFRLFTVLAALLFVLSSVTVLASLSKALYNYFTEAKAYEEYLENRETIEKDEDETNPEEW